MDPLREARTVIDETDRAMARLFRRRMEAVAQIAAWKKSRGLPIRDAEREESLRRQLNDALDAPELVPYYDAFLQGVLEISRAYQADLLGAEEADHDPQH